MKTLWCAILIAALAFHLGCVPEAPDPEPASGPEAVAMIQAATDAYAEAFVAGDAALIASLNTEDVIVSPAELGDFRGRPEVLAFFQESFPDLAISVYQFSVLEAEIYGDVAYDRGTYAWVSTWLDRPEERVTGRYSAVRHRGSDGVWRVHRYIENEL